AQGRDVFGHLLLRPGAYGDEGDHRGDADDDPEHRQDRPQAIAAQRPARGRKDLRDPHLTATSSTCSIRPSRMWMIRSAFSATSRSCVTMTTVRPCSLSSRKSAMISSP